MPPSTPSLPTDRLAVGQLLVRLLHQFRLAMFNLPEGAEFTDIRFAHLPIWGNVGVDGIRLTDLADRANLSLAACSELVNDLQSLGYLERRPDPTDGRAKLIHPTAKGRALLEAAGRRVAEIEAAWRALVPDGDFDRACVTFDRLVTALGEGADAR
jgi:DNA-binding MarR family transcriptional regulator